MARVVEIARRLQALAPSRQVLVGVGGGGGGPLHSSVEPAEGVVTLELNRPDRLHALSEAMGVDIIRVCRTLARERPTDVRAVVVVGADCGRHRPASFSTGRDLRDTEALEGAESQERYMRLALESVMAVRALPMPVVAAVNGHALGWGLELALACDVRVVARSASLGCPETSLGIFPGAGGAVLLPQVVGLPRALELVLTSRKVKGEEAARVGLAHEVVDDATTRALEVAAEVAANAPLAVREAKRVMRVATDGLPGPNGATAFEAALRAASEARIPLSATADHHRAVAAFAGKGERPVRFTGE